MGYITDAIGISLLAVIAIELFFLRRDFFNLYHRTFPEARRARTKGQTINVNVSSPPPTERERTALVLEQDQGKENPPPQERGANNGEEARERRQDERVRMAEETPKITRGAFTVVKCPACGMENTSFRSECFNCGAHL